jgi:hypothetical protein
MDPELREYHKKTEKELSEFRREIESDLKEWRRELGQTISDVATETRERFRRADDERDGIKDLNKTEFGKIADKLDRLTGLALSTNGKVQKHEEEIYGTPNDKGLKSKVGSLGDSRTWVTVLIGFICTLCVIAWTIWGSDLRARGIVNKTDAEEIDLIDRQIWKHAHPENGNTH